ncbi:MAG: hypothetical protein QOG64_2983 [Acidimicrobiaceae bacterium]|nr:hypothetical protein [Acidimicrobiaceae bacterium]
MELFDLTGHVAIVTGGNSGIGLASPSSAFHTGDSMLIEGGYAVS